MYSIKKSYLHLPPQDDIQRADLETVADKLVSFLQPFLYLSDQHLFLERVVADVQMEI